MLRLRALLAACLASAAAWATEPATRLDVLRADAYGATLDVLLRLEPPAELAEAIGPGDFTVYLAPASLPAAEAAAPAFRVRRLFAKRLGSAWHLDLRQSPPGVGGTALQLIVQVAHGGRLLATHRLGQFLGAPADALDVALIIDESLSMTRTDPEWLRIAAAKTFVDLARRSTRIGHIALVAFNDKARTLVPLTSTAQPDALYRAINNISAMGQTDMDAALAEAHKALEQSSSPNKVALLLSDGKDEPGVYENAHRAFAEKRWRVYTVGLSNRADAEVLQRIAAETGGDYHSAPTNAELQDIFSKICVTLHRKVPIRSRGLSLQTQAPVEDGLFVDDTISALTVRLDSRDGDIAFTLRDSRARLLTPDLPKADQTVAYGRKAGYQHYDLWGPAPGRCVARLESPRPAQVNLAATAVTPLLLRAFPLQPAYRRGEPIEVAASLANADTVLADARVEARITTPDGATIAQPLFDDGQHGDTDPSDGVFAATIPGFDVPGACVLRLVAVGTTPAGHRFEREVDATTTISTEDVRPPRLVLSADRLDLGAIESGERAAAALGLRLEPRGAAAARITSSDPRLAADPATLDLTTREATTRIAFAAPPETASGQIRATLAIETAAGNAQVPAEVRVVKPSLTLSAEAIDFGEVVPGQTVERHLTLRLAGLRPREATLTPTYLAGPPGAPSMAAVVPERVALKPGEPTAVQIRLDVPPAQAPGGYRGEVAIRSALGERTVACTVRVGAASTFQAAATLDFERVAIGASKEAVVEVTSLVAAEQRLEVRPPQPGAGWQLAVEPQSLVLPPNGKGRLAFRLTVSPLARPGPIQAVVAFQGPSRGASLEARATLFRPPHESIAFEPAVVDVGRLQAGVSERVQVRVRSLVDEPQAVALEGANFSPDIVAAAVRPEQWTLDAAASGELTLTLLPASGPQEAPFEGRVTARGRSLPATLLVRGSVFTPPGVTFTVAEPVLDFGAMSPGQTAELALVLQSVLPREQRVSLAAAPASDGVMFSAQRAGAVLLPGVAHPLGIQVSVAPHAASGEREAVWEVRGPGAPATFRVRVEVVLPPPAVAATTPGKLGWVEGILLFLLLCLLLAILAATYLLARRLLRSNRVPRMAKYFALSALLHAAALFVTLDIFLAEKVRKQEIGPLFQVGLKALAPSAFSSQQASVADELRAQAERERRLDAERRQQEAARVARALLESERRKLDPAAAPLDRPEAQEKPDLAPNAPDTERFTIEELAEIVEELREATQAARPAAPEARQAAEVEAQRVAQLRAMSREQIEEAVRAALQPKAAEPARAVPIPDSPGLSRTQAAEKATLAPDELVPAIEALRQEAARTEEQAAAGSGASLAAETTQAQRASHEHSVERGTGAGERVLVADARLSGAASRAVAPPRLLEPALRGAGAAPEEPKAPPAFATPDEAVTAAEGAQRAAAPPSSRSGMPDARQVGASRALAGAPLERGAAGTMPVVVGAARPVSETGPAAREPMAALVPKAVEGTAASVPREAPIAFASPEEQPTVDPMVQPPATQGESRAELRPAAVTVSRAEDGVASGGGRDTARAAAAAVGPPDTVPGAASAGRPALTAAMLPERSADAGSPMTRRVAMPDEIELAERPVTVARREAAPARGLPGPQVVVAPSRSQGRSEEWRRDAAAASVGSSAARPRAAVAEKPSSGSASELAVEWQREGRRESPEPVELPQESVAAGRRVAEGAARPGSIAPADVGASRGDSVAAVERGAASASRSRVLAARPAEAGPSRAAAAAVAGLPDARPPREVGRQVPAPGLAATHLDETVRAATRLAAAGGGSALVEMPTAAARAQSHPAATEAAREARATRPDSLSPRSIAVAPTAARASSKLLLPALASRGEEAGAVVGDASGSVRSFVLTTVKYGGGEADWDAHRTAMPFLAWQLRERVGFNLETDVLDVPLDSPKVMNSPWVFMTGHKDFRLTDGEVAGLRRYLLAGGTLWAEDCTHEDDPTWDRAFRREIARVLPRADGYQLAKIEKAHDHPLLRSCFDLSQGYKGYWPPPGDKYRQSFLEGIEINGRLGVIYTRNDYACGLEIKPDTHPGKVSLSSLSPAEMQEASFLMASNIIVYALTGGRGTADRGLAGRAADSLRRQREAAAAQRDPYENAPATLFDSFSEDLWAAEDTWQQAGPATLRYLRHADPGAEGRRLAVNFRLRRDDAKAVIIRDLPQEQDLSGHDRCYVEVESRLEGGARLSIALVTMPDWKYFESRPAFLKPGRQRVYFDLRAPTWKTGEPVAEGETEYSRRPANLETVRRVAILLYPIQREGAIVLDRIELRSKP